MGVIDFFFFCFGFEVGVFRGCSKRFQTLPTNAVEPAVAHSNWILDDPDPESNG
jgi:hypothetical protein